MHTQVGKGKNGIEVRCAPGSVLLSRESMASHCGGILVRTQEEHSMTLHMSWVCILHHIIAANVMRGFILTFIKHMFPIERFGEGCML